MSTLIAYAAPREGEVVLGKHADTLALGVGKIAAAMSLAVALTERSPDAVLLIGVCGAYPDRHLRRGLASLRVHDLCVVGSEVIADDGVATPDGYLDLAQLRLGEIGPLPCDPELTSKLAAVLGCPIVAGATVSTGAGNDVLSHAYAQRSGAQVETMEGGAVAAVCRRFGVPFAQLRAVSNRTGDRHLGGWDLDGSLAQLALGVERVLAAGVLP
ncbi:MAG TPA: futalosine hydrolase [Enhygromyxa sp.]|nr:futalosine hydrolase [Enhygromyxa sp.]